MTLLRAYNARRDGSLVGSIGYETPEDGITQPLIVLKGRQVKIRNLDRLNDFEVESFLGGSNYEVARYFNTVYKATFKNGFLRVGTKMAKVPESYAPFTKEPISPEIEKCFPAPQEIADTLQPQETDWYAMPGGIQIGSVEFMEDLHMFYRVAVRMANGRVSTLSSCVPGLKGYTVEGLDFVSNGGNWFVIDATKEPRDLHGEFHGNDLFWIEAR